MSKKQSQIWEIVMETVTAIAILVYLGLQIYYQYAYESSITTIVYHLLPMLLIYIGMTVLQQFPELLNGSQSEPLRGRVRIYAIHMIRSSKLLIVLGLLFPSVADAVEIQLNASYSLFIIGGVLIVIGYYLYRIYQHNANEKENH